MKMEGAFGCKGESKGFVKRSRWFKRHPLILHSVVAVAALVQSLALGQEHPRRYEFVLEKGKGTEVCNAYVRRLNQETFTTYPFCDRPEDDSVPGFKRLHREPLPSSEIVRLFPSVEGLIRVGNPSEFDRPSRTDPAVPESVGIRKYAQRYAEEEVSFISRGLPRFYRFAPPIDIDNDGSADKVIVWKDTGRVCGAVYTAKPVRTRTHMLLLDAHNNLDVARSRTIFGHPMGNLFTYKDRKSGRQQTLDLSRTFRTVGDTYGTFVYQGKTYFDTFYGGLGDLQNKRVGQTKLGDTLAVFKRENDKTELQCEILWRDSRPAKPTYSGSEP